MKIFRPFLLCLLLFILSLFFFAAGAAAESITATSPEELADIVSHARKDTTILLKMDRQEKEIALENTATAQITLDGQGSEQGSLRFLQGAFVLENMAVENLYLNSSKNPVHVTVGEKTIVSAVQTRTPELTEFRANNRGTITLVNKGSIAGYGIRVMAGTAAVTIENEGDISGGIGIFSSDFWYNGNGVPQASGKRRIINNGTITGVMGPGIAWFASKGTDFELTGSGTVRGISGIALFGSTASGKITVDHSVETICQELNEDPSLGRAVYDYYELNPEGRTAENLADHFMKDTMGKNLDYFMFIADYPGYPLILHTRTLAYKEKPKTATNFSLSGTLLGEKGCMVLPEAAHMTGKIRMDTQIAPGTPLTYVWSYCPDGKVFGVEDAPDVLQASLKKYPWCAEAEDWYIGLVRRNDQGGYIYLAGNNDLLPAEFICHIRPDGTVTSEDAVYFSNDKNRASQLDGYVGDYGSPNSTVFLDSDIMGHTTVDLRPGFKNMTVDGGNHSCSNLGLHIRQEKSGDTFTVGNFASLSSLTLSTKKNSTLVLHDIGNVRSSMDISGDGTVEIKNVNFGEGDGYSTAATIKLDNKGPVIFDKTCSISSHHLLSTFCTNAKLEIRLDCPYGNAEFLIQDKGTLSLTGTGQSEDTMKLKLVDSTAQHEVETSVDTMEIVAGSFRGQLKLSGRQKKISISPGHDKWKLLLSSAGIEELKFEIDVQGVPVPQNVEEAMTQVRKSFSGLDYSAATDRNGNPVAASCHLIIRDSKDINKITQITFLEGDPESYHSW